MDSKETRITDCCGFAFAVIVLVICFLAPLFRRKRKEKWERRELLLPVKSIQSVSLKGATTVDISSIISPVSDCELAPAASAPPPPPPKETKTLAAGGYDSPDIDKIIRSQVDRLFNSKGCGRLSPKKWKATVKVSNVSLEATERDIKQLFDYCGGIKFVEMQSDNDNEMCQIAYVMFRSMLGAETAVLLSGAIIMDKPVAITPAPDHVPPLSPEDIRREVSRIRKYLISLPRPDGEAYEGYGERITKKIRQRITNKIQARKQLDEFMKRFLSSNCARR